MESPLFSDTEPLSHDEGDQSGSEDDFMTGFMNADPTKSPETRAAEAAYVIAFVNDELLLDDMPDWLRLEALERKAVYERIMLKQEQKDAELARRLQSELSRGFDEEIGSLESKKRKLEEEDAAFARRLQAELNSAASGSQAQPNSSACNGKSLSGSSSAKPSLYLGREEVKLEAYCSLNEPSNSTISPGDIPVKSPAIYSSSIPTRQSIGDTTKGKNTIIPVAEVKSDYYLKVWNDDAGCFGLENVKPPKFIPPAPNFKSSTQANLLLDKSKTFNLAAGSLSLAKPLYDMNSLLSQKSQTFVGSSSSIASNGQTPFLNPDEFFDKDLDSFSRPLKEEEVTEQLKDLLENVAITAAVPPVEERMESPSDLKVTLLEHQKIGVDWMLKMERGTNKGGILADDMGLGKTVQSITCCILNAGTNPSRKTTLIVAPTSLILQWKEELKSKVKAGVFKVLVYYGKERKGKSANTLRQYDIVITTYGTLAMEWPETKKRQKSRADAPSFEDEDEVFARQLKEDEEDRELMIAQRGELFKVHWHRVILDEAHLIKNKATRSARAAVQLLCTHRWCLTGTPIQNKVGELYSLIRFLNIRPYSDWGKFRDDIEKPFKAGRHKRVMRRVQALLKAICLRRTKNSKLDGRPIITLPPKQVELVEADFTPVEREFYTSLEQKTLLKFNAYLKEGTVMQNYSNVLVLLLRLRQACCHPSLVAQKFEKASPEALAAAKASDATQAIISPLEVLALHIQERLLSVNLMSGYECPICFDALNDGKIISSCGHVYCADCILGHVAAAANGADEEKVCPQCRGEIDVDSLVSVDKFVSSARKAGLLDVKKVSKSDSGAVQGLSNDVSECCKDDTLDQWISSTKIDQLMKFLVKTRREHPQDKTIVFSQFRGMMDLCERPLTENGIRFVRYDGSMTAEQRDAAVQILQHDIETNVILVSLKCGSLGLNLTCANRVVILDFWWNVAVENQAVDRVHRFGQMKEVLVHRISIKDTVEQRILQLQKEKQELFNAALGEGGVKGLSNARLGLRDLIHLFKGSGDAALSDDES